MSEFTTGILYPRKYEPSVLKMLPQSRQPYFHQNVNDHWNAFFLEDEWLERADTLRFLLQLSAQPVPLLWFHDAEESGWGFRLFDGGMEVSSATIPYSLDIEMTEAEFARRFPAVQSIDEISEQEELRRAYDEILEQVVRSVQFRQELSKGIARFRHQCFSRFVSAKQAQQLRSLFDINLLADFDEESGSSILYDSVDLFKEILGIEEMIWVNYTYLASGGAN
ncbi:hypothetical protein G3578_09570 [Brevibacillus sp. SYP-B805]|uniref:hypothetical protein n=1 Tax=Brevibacillus sp. SYP-B805 TaxID=1578199 RepID=UPI0013EC1256|nr:hypothetical protein [Brevibacillus sp. SYP-B805]NGQ95403.1 hypothetical protein [Brevibacillus sp. SYP-B805]